jgi:SAM-dependent methyltransferase
VRPGTGSRAPFPDAPIIDVEDVPCGMCGGADRDWYAESYDYEYQTCGNAWQFHRCRNCANVYLTPRPAAGTLPIIYPPHYYAYNYDVQVNAVARRAKAWLDARRFAAIRSALGVPIEGYLDIGCGDGRYLRAMRAMGVPASGIYGIELDAGVASKLNAEGFRVFDRPVEQVNGLPRGGLQLITMFSVLEHVAAPRALMRECLDLLAPGGLFVFEVPNVDSLNARIARDRFWGGYHTPRHWNIFGVATVQRVAGELGFTVVKIERSTGHAFWLWSLHHFLRFGLGWDRIGRWMNPFRCLPGLAVVTPIDLVRARLNQETDNMVCFLRK